MEKRNVLVLDPLGTLRTELQQFKISSIALHYAQSAAAAKLAVLEKGCTVGLVMFDLPPVIAPS